MTLIEQVIKELAEKHGSIRAAARVVKIEPSFLHRLATGERTSASDKTLRALGLKAVTIYKRLGE